MGDERSGGNFGGKRFEGAGGTPGGLGEFFVGVLLAGIGVYLLLDQVTVHTSFWGRWGGMNSFGITLVPLLLGVGILFFNGRSLFGWLLFVGGLGVIIAGIVMHMDIYFRPTSLWATLMMLALIAGGIGLIAKGLRPHRAKS